MEEPRVESSPRSSDPGLAVFSVAGHHVVVTGGTSGIGLMIAEDLVRAGAIVLVTSRKAEACATTEETLGAHGAVHSVAADVSTAEGVETIRSAVDRLLDGRVDLLVNNAGASWGAPLEAFPRDAWRKVMTTNVDAVFHLTVGLLPALRQAVERSGRSAVINVGSVDGIAVPAHEGFPYAASKAAVHQLTAHLARRLAGDSISVNAIAPGWFASKMTAFMTEDPATLQRMERTVPLGRVGGPEDVAAAVRYLGSPAGAYLTGVVLPVDGGLTGCLGAPDVLV